MNPAQLAARQSILAGPRLRVVNKLTFSAAAASLAMDVPKIQGLLCVKAIFSFGGNATPGTPTGFTNLNNAAAGASIPGLRLAYKFLDGSEANSLSSAATSATEMMAVAWLIRGALRAYVPTGGNTSGTSATANHGTLTIPAGGSCRMVLFANMWRTTQTITQLPQDVRVDPSTLVQLQSTSFLYGFEANFERNALPATTVIGSASAGYRSTTIAVRGQ